jgi:hypothetical protein
MNQLFTACENACAVAAQILAAIVKQIQIEKSNAKNAIKNKPFWFANVRRGMTCGEICCNRLNGIAMIAEIIGWRNNCFRCWKNKLSNCSFLMCRFELNGFVLILATATFLFGHAAFTALFIFVMKQTPAHKLVHAIVQMNSCTHASGCINGQ